MIRRPPRSTQSRSSAASDVYKRQGLNREPARRGWNRSAAQTPIWQATELSTRTVVLTAAKPRLSFGVWFTHSAGTVALMVKYIANKPAKNISSLASHTMVPTETGFGRVTVTCGGALVAAVADDTRPLWPNR